jgi:imidazolonepropionase-like amidohydrolase
MMSRCVCCLVLLTTLRVSPIVGLLFWLGSIHAADTGTAPDVGVRFQPPADVFLQNADVVHTAKKQHRAASLLIRGGKIAAIGTDLIVPAGVEVIDCSGKQLYPAFVDALVEFDSNPVQSPAGYWNSLITPHKQMAEAIQSDKSKLEQLRKAGVGVILAVPKSGLIKGQSCVLSTADAAYAQTLLADAKFQHMRLYPERGGSERYPNSPMGATALVRQVLLDADWYQRAQQAASSNPSLPLPEQNVALKALQATIRGEQTVVMDGTNELYALRADRLAREFFLKLVIRGSGREYRQLEAVVATGRNYIIPVDFPDPPKLNTEAAIQDVTLQTLMHWRLAPENPGRLERAGVEFVLTTDGLEKPTELLTKIRLAVRAGLSEQRALAALTSAPARLLGVEHQVGSLEVGKLANILITDGPLWAQDTKLEETWVQGQRARWQAAEELDPRGRWELISPTSTPPLRLEIAGKLSKLTARLGLLTDAVAPATEAPQAAQTAKTDQAASPSTLELKELEFNALGLSGVFENQGLAGKPNGRAWLTVTPLFEAQKISAVEVSLLWPDGSTTRYSGQPASATAGQHSPGENTVDATQPATDKPENRQAQAERPPSPKRSPPGVEKLVKPDSSAPSTEVACDVNYPLGAYGRAAPPEQPPLLLIKNATLWTCDAAGIIENGDMLVRNGIIDKVGPDLEAVDGAIVFDATGLHISPGIIDCHSHMATDGGVNESGQAITAEVRVGDFIDCNDITIYRQLAGGVTTSNILHGSANPIGGQNQVIKLRWGGLDEELKMREAPGGIKFALGENVKQSNREGNSSRYPQSRMGVEQIMRDRLEAALDYRRQWQRPAADQSTLPPRRDLELEAIAEILDGQRWVHCHSYRHILEGYKVADAMAAHGATGSSFSDWWAYKFEVFDAIPYNGALMHRAGVIVSFNSDDAELARHLNHEAAKAVKYGGVEPSEALKFVTLNPAKQLRIDRWVGSLTPGKQADFVVWNRPPLSTLSVCTQTWIDGRKYFDRQESEVLYQQQAQLRFQLIQMALQKPGATSQNTDDKDPSTWWLRYDEFCHHGHSGHDDHGHQHEHQDEQLKHE